MIRKCRRCGKEFDTISNNQKYCTADCRTKARASKLKVTEYQPRICIVCGDEFIPTAGKQRRCRECISRAIKRRCPQCGGTAEGNRKYCSKECMRIYKAAKKANSTSGKLLADINAKARAEGLTYGQYMAKHGLY